MVTKGVVTILKRLMQLNLFLFVVSFVLIACANNGGEDHGNNHIDEQNAESTIDPITVYTTLYSLEDFTKRIGGDFVEVTNLIPAGTDAHSFEPTASQMIEIAEGDLFIYNGAGFEGFAERIKETVAAHEVTVLTASDGVELYHHDHEEDGDHGHSHGQEDLHIWLDPLRAIQMAENIKDALVRHNPEREGVFQENFSQLKSELEQLDEEFLSMVNTVSKETIVVSHAGYGYWEERYGIHQVGISGLSPSNEPSVKQIQKVIEFIEEQDINYLMLEKNIPSNIIETVQGETDVDVLWLHNLESLTSEEVEAGEDYFSLMNRNIENLRTALQ